MRQRLSRCFSKSMRGRSTAMNGGLRQAGALQGSVGFSSATGALARPVSRGRAVLRPSRRVERLDLAASQRPSIDFVRDGAAATARFPTEPARFRPTPTLRSTPNFHDSRTVPLRTATTRPSADRAATPPSGSSATSTKLPAVAKSASWLTKSSNARNKVHTRNPGWPRRRHFEDSSPRRKHLLREVHHGRDPGNPEWALSSAGTRRYIPTP